MNKICIISGPTASGKTQTSINLAKSLGGEIINFDSLLFYKELNIGTAKPTLEEREGIPHYMIDIESISNPINAADFVAMATPLITKILNKKKLIYLVGGSGFYLQALLYGMFDSPTTPEAIIQKSNTLYQEEGITPFLEILEKSDTESFKRLHSNDHYRIRRAVEHFWTTNIPFSQAKKEMEEQRKVPLYQKQGWELHHIYLDLPKEEHFKIIQKRTNKMVEEGLIQEVQTLLQNNFTGQEKPLQSIGYKECLRFLQEKDYTQEQMIEDINISTRQLAKAQRTWFKKWKKNSYHPLSDQNKINDDLKSFLTGERS